MSRAIRIIIHQQPCKESGPLGTTRSMALPHAYKPRCTTRSQGGLAQPTQRLVLLSHPNGHPRCKPITCSTRDGWESTIAWSSTMVRRLRKHWKYVNIRVETISRNKHACTYDGLDRFDLFCPLLGPFLSAPQRSLSLLTPLGTPNAP